MGFTENYLERRKRRTGQSLTAAPQKKEAAPAASSGSGAGNDFTARYLARREVRAALPEVPALSLPSLPGTAARTPAEAKKAATAVTARAVEKKPTVDFRGIPLEYSPDGVTSQSFERAQAGTFGGGTVNRNKQGFQGGRTPGRTPGRLENVLKGAAAQYGGNMLSSLGTTLELMNAREQERPHITGEMVSGSELAKQAAERETKNLAAEKQLAGAVRGLSRDASQYGQEQVEQAKKGLNGLGQFAVDVGAGGAQMAADIGLGQLTGLGTMGPLVLRSFGGGAEEAAQEGANLQQQAQYGAASALTEFLTEKISSLGNFNTEAFGSGALDDILEGAVAAVERMGKTDVGRKILNHAASAGVGFLSEGAEEFVSGIVSPLMKRAIYSKEPIDWKNVISEAGYEFLTGGAIGAISGGIGGTSTGDIQQAYLSGATERAQNNAYQTMADKGLFSPEARTAARDAVRQMDAARTRSGVPPLQLPTVEGLKAAQNAQEGKAAPEGTRIPGAPQVVQNGPQAAPEGIKNSAPAGTAAIKAGRATEIKNPYTGTVPSYKKPNNALIPQISAQALMEARSKIQTAQQNGLQSGKSFKNFLEDFYEKEFQESGGARGVPVLGAEMDGKPYIVTVNKSAVGKVVSDKNVSAEKMAVFAVLDDVIENGEYVGSSEYIQKGNKKKDTIRFDLFETPVSIDGKRYIVTFDVEVFPSVNNYRTHKVINELDLVPEGVTDTGTGQPQQQPGRGPISGEISSEGDAKGVNMLNPDASSNAPVAIVQPANANVNPVNFGENDGMSRKMADRLVRMGETPDSAERIGSLLGRVAEGQQLTDSEWSEIGGNPNAARLAEIAREIARRNSAVNNAEGVTNHGTETGVHLPDGRADRGAGQDPGRPDGAVPAGAEQRAAAGEPAGYRQVDGEIQSPVKDRRSGRQNLKAIERQEAVTASGAQMVSTREYMGLGSDRPCLFEATEDVIRSDRVLSEVYDEIWEMGYKPHMFTGTPEMEDGNFSFNGAVQGENVFIRIDHNRYDADAIWDHEKFHILSAEDPELRSSVRDAVLEKYGEDGLRGRLETYLDKYRGAYGMENAQGLAELSDSDLEIILEELLADAYAGKDTYSAGVQEYRDTVRDAASQREGEGRMVRGPPEGTRFDIGYDRNNRPFVTVEEDILEGVPREEWVRTVKDNLRKKFPGGVTVGNSTITINAKSRNEMTLSRYMKWLSRTEPKLFADKLRATTNADEILRASQNWVNEALLHPRTDAILDFARGEVQLRVGENDYTAQVIVGNRGGGALLLYDVINLEPTKIQERTKKAATGETDSPNAGTDSRKPASAEATVPQPAQDVKPLTLPTVDSNVEKTGESVDNTRFSADEPDQRRTTADQRKAAARKLADDLMEIFPESGKKYLRDLADEIRAGASQDHLDALFNDTYDSAKVYDESPEAQELREIAHELRGRRVYVDPSVREEFGDDWNATRQFFFGKGLYLTGDSSDAGLDQLNAEMASRFGGRFRESETDMSAVVSRLEYILRTGANKQISLDEQARQYGGEEAARQFREAYRQRFMDAAEGYQDTINGIDEAQRTTREAARQQRRKELEDYVSQARQSMRDRAARGMDTGKINERTHVPDGMDIDQYVDSLQKRAAQAREERMQTVLRENFRGSEAMEKLGIRITGTVTDDYQNAGDIRKRSAAAEQARKAVRLAEKRLNASEAEMQFAAGITEGYYTERDIPRTMDADKIMELSDYYMGERAFGFDLLKQRKADISRAQQEKAKAIFGPALEASEGKPRLVKGAISRVLGDGFMLNNRTAERNMRAIFGDEAGEKINQWLFSPVAENEGERYRFVNRMMDQVREIEDGTGKKKALTKTESALVQKVLEGRAAADSVASAEMGEAIQNAAKRLNEGGEMQDIAREFKLDEGNRKLARQYAQWLTTQEELQGADTVKIENAVKLYSDLYNQFYEAVNDFLTVHGYEPIGFIKGYAPHMQSQEANTALQSAFQSLGLGADVSGLPTSIAGQTKNFKPNKRWNPFFLTRTGMDTTYDIVGGFERYVDHLSDVLYHTDDITRIREANKFLRKMYDQEEISENISRAKELKYKSVREKRDFLVDQGELDPRKTMSDAEIDKAMDDYSDRLYESVGNTTQYGQLAVYLDDYANMLAGKQLFSDRDMERSFGRTSLNVGNRLTRAFTRAQVSGNLSSVLNQMSQLPIIRAELGEKYTLHALRDNWNGRLRRGEWALKSDFLAEKNGMDYITSSPEDMIIGALFKPLDFMDGYLSTLAVRGRYLKEIDAGKSEAEAMRIADRFGRGVMGSRAKGSAPLAFQEKGVISRMLHAFQLEALNTWEHISQDLPRDFRAIEKSHGKSAAARAFAGVAVKILIGNFLLNRSAEMLYGGTPAQGDVLGIIGNFIASGGGTTLNAMTISALKSIINVGWEKVMGERLFDDDGEDEEEEKPFDLGGAVKEAGSDMLNDAPMVKNLGALFGVGDLTLPMPDVIAGIGRTVNAINEDGAFSWEVMRQLMGLAGDLVPGGRQAEKTFQGLDTALRGGRFSGYGEDEKLMYPVDENPFTALRAALFGNSALKENGEYYASGRKALSAEQTRVYKEAVASGGKRQEIYEAILDWREVNGDDDLTSEEKARLGEEIVGGVELGDREKLAFYRGLNPRATARADKLAILMDAGMDWDGAIGAFAKYDEIKRKEGLSAGQKATEFARWADENYPAKQAKAVREQFKYYSQIPAEAGRYDKLTGAGLDAKTSFRLSDILDRLTPEAGKTQVSALQKAKAVLSAGLNQEEQLKALEAVMSEAEFQKVQAGVEQNVSPELYVEAKEALSNADTDGSGTVSQDEAKMAIKAMDGLTKEQRAALWQLQNKSWSAENNPFHRKTGRAVFDTLHQKVEGLTLPKP